jgi:hypothetical protein
MIYRCPRCASNFCKDDRCLSRQRHTPDDVALFTPNRSFPKRKIRLPPRDTTTAGSRLLNVRGHVGRAEE